MDRVFVSGKNKNKKNTFKQFLSNGNGIKQKKPNDAATEYFPYSGGDGVDSHEFQSRYLSYEPAESMLDSPVDIEDDSSYLQWRNVKRVLLKGSKYEVYGPKIESIDTLPKENEPKATSKHQPEPEPPSSESEVLRKDELGDFWTFQWLNSLPTSMEACIPYIREISQKSIVLYPVDMVADHVEGLEVIVAGLEVFLLMLIADKLAGLVQLICRPAVILASMAFKLF